MQYAKVCQIYNDKIAEDSLKEIVRFATDEDTQKYLKNLKDADIALKKAIKFANDLGLSMKIINAQFTLERTQLLFNFTADDRVDFRELAKNLLVSIIQELNFAKLELEIKLRKLEELEFVVNNFVV